MVNDHHYLAKYVQIVNVLGRIVILSKAHGRYDLAVSESLGSQRKAKTYLIGTFNLQTAEGEIVRFERPAISDFTEQ